MLGSLTVDKLGPRRQMMLMLVIQGIVGFIMSGELGFSTCGSVKC